MDLDFFTKLLTQRLEKLQYILSNINNSISTMQSGSAKCDGDLSALFQQENLDSGMISLYQQEVKDIKHALQKIKNKTFGICEGCDESIDIERLKAKPHARYCIECREEYEKALQIKNKGVANEI